jgi:predicted XRE-type DNA-binding protein
MTMTEYHITPAGGNIFADLGFPAEEAENLKIRSSLMIAIEKIMKSRGLKQAEAAKLFGVTQPRISDIKRGKIDVFTIDSLVNMLTHAGIRVDFTLSEAA